MTTTIRELIAREQEILTPKIARRAALSDALTELGRMSKSDGDSFAARAVGVKTDWTVVDGEIARHEARIRLLSREQALEEKVAALSNQSIRFPDHDSPEYPDHRQRMGEEADKRRAEIEREQDAIFRELEELR